MALNITDLSFKFPKGDRILFENLSLSLAEGESLSLMAPSGTGKTTLLAIIGGLLQPTNGTVSVTTDGTSPPVLSWILQTVNLLPRRSVLDNVTLPSVIRGAARHQADEQALDIITKLGLDHRVSMAARQLSGGEAARVGIARALMTKPDLLLADEPTANLDQGNAHRIIESLLTYSEKSCVVIATHDPAIAALTTHQLNLSDYSPLTPLS